MSKSIGFNPDTLASHLGVRKIDLENGLVEMLDPHYAGGGSGGGGDVTSVNEMTGDVVLTASDIPEELRGDVQTAITHLEEALEDIQVLTPLDIEEYGDFNDIKWLDLLHGGYFITGGGSQFMNPPFEITHPSFNYEVRVEVRGGEDIYEHKLTSVNTGALMRPEYHFRVGHRATWSNTRNDWVRLDLGGIAKYRISYKRSDFSIEVPTGESLNLTDTIQGTGLVKTGATISRDGVNIVPRVELPYAVNGGFKIPYLPDLNDQHINIQIRLEGTVSGSATPKTAKVYLKKVDGGSIVSHENFIKDDDQDFDRLVKQFKTWAFGKDDTFVTDGFYFELQNDSGRTFTITGIEMLLMAY